MADGFGPFVSFESVSQIRASFACLLLAVVYVVSLYINKSPLPRDHPKTVYQRFRRVAVVSVLAPVYVWIWSTNESQHHMHSLWTILGLHTKNIVMATVLPLLLTMILFLGPLVLMFLEDSLHLEEDSYICPSSWIYTIKMRNYVVAPLTEEFVYRACMLPLLAPSFGIGLSIVVCPLLFGVAHIHHVIERLKTGTEKPKQIWISALFQFTYTTLFGGYSAFLFLRTGHLVGPVVCHSFCNFMGFPPLADVPHSKYPKVISTLFVVGLLLFLLLARPLTEPSLYGSIYYT